MRLARCSAPAPIPFVTRCISALAIVASATTARAQSLSASELAIVSQVVDGTRITVEYSRPRARGRTHLFGTEVPFGRVWTPGANQSTTLAVSKDVSIDGHPVPKGKYSVWMAISAGDWDLVLDHDTTRYHTNPPTPGGNQIRIPVERMHHDFTEVLTWSFPAVSTSGMTLVMRWDTVSVPLAITVARSFTTAVPADAAQRVAGTYIWRDAAIGASDTTAVGAKAQHPGRFTVRYAGGELHATIDPPMFGDPAYGVYVLIQKKGDLYSMGRIDRGELIEVIDYCTLQFSPANGHPRSFEVRATDDDLWASGTIAP
jgi:Protein of unknown function (DUF2911)